MVVGLTGGYCAGKDRVARIFASHGFRVIDVDEIGHEVLAQKEGEVAAAFGPDVRSPGGGVDRKALGAIVFADPAARARLEEIVHPAMAQRVREILSGGRGDWVINAAVLHRMGLHALCDAIVCVSAPALLRLLRAVRRDRYTLREAAARIGAQRGICPQLNDPGVDTYNVRNGGTARSLERRVDRLVHLVKGR